MSSDKWNQIKAELHRFNDDDDDYDDDDDDDENHAMPQVSMSFCLASRLH